MYMSATDESVKHSIVKSFCKVDSPLQIIQGRSQDFYQVGAQLESDVVVYSLWQSCAWPALLAMGAGGGGGAPSCRRWKVLVFLALQLSISIDFHVF